MTETIKEILEEKGELENVRSGLMGLLNVALELVKELAPQGTGERLGKEIANYIGIMRIARDYLTEEQVREVSERFNQLSQLWVSSYQPARGAKI